MKIPKKDRVVTPYILYEPQEKKRLKAFMDYDEVIRGFLRILRK
jgi:hypothetical protein